MSLARYLLIPSDGVHLRLTNADQGSGIGRATAIGFAQAGAKNVFLIGRTEATLKETSEAIKKLPSNTETSIFVASVTDELAVHQIAKKIGVWDVLILNAAHLSPPDTILNIPVEAFWTSYEVGLLLAYFFLLF